MRRSWRNHLQRRGRRKTRTARSRPETSTPPPPIRLITSWVCMEVTILRGAGDFLSDFRVHAFATSHCRIRAYAQYFLSLLLAFKDQQWKGQSMLSHTWFLIVLRESWLQFSSYRGTRWLSGQWPCSINLVEARPELYFCYVQLTYPLRGKNGCPKICFV